MTYPRQFTAACLLAVALLGACDAATAPVHGRERDISGRWSYQASSSDRATLVAGTLDVTHQAGSVITGVLEAQEADSYGVLRVVRGIVGGRVTADSSLAFDVVLTGGRTRRHIGTMVGDSVRGAWIETADVQVLGTGSFRGHKERP